MALSFLASILDFHNLINTNLAGPTLATGHSEK